MERLILFLVGYFCGSIQCGYLLGKLKGIDIRQYGSRNTGATNSLRVMGTGAGIIVLLGDVLKAIIPCLVVRFLYASKPEIQSLMVLWMGLGAMIGHDFPFYLGFQGGKGVATTVGILLVLHFKLGLAWIGVFMVVAVLFRYVSLASITAMLFLAGAIVVGAGNGLFGLGEAYRTEFVVAGLVIPLLSIWRHRTNIVRLLKGEENRLKLFTKGMKIKR